MLLRSIQIVFVLSIVFISGCASTSNQQAVASVATDPRDPLELINRPFWRFTWDYADKYLLRPVSLAYTEHTPTFVRSGLYNMAKNLDEPSSIINNLLQAKFSDAATSSGRFVLNSTIGLLGFFDPASDFGWLKQEEEFGEVLGKYGVSDGPFLVVPGLGPSSVREEVGDFVDRYYWPLAVIDFWPNLLRVAVKGMEQRAELVQQEQMINEAIDPYEFIKNAYFQNVRFKVYDGHPPIEVNNAEEAELESYLQELEGQ
jgi:phospholipid-binding lipoprotein MlaA